MHELGKYDYLILSYIISGSCRCLSNITAYSFVVSICVGRITRLVGSVRIAGGPYSILILYHSHDRQLGNVDMGVANVHQELHQALYMGPGFPCGGFMGIMVSHSFISLGLGRGEDVLFFWLRVRIAYWRLLMCIIYIGCIYILPGFQLALRLYNSQRTTSDSVGDISASRPPNDKGPVGFPGYTQVQDWFNSRIL